MEESDKITEEAVKAIKNADVIPGEIAFIQLRDNAGVNVYFECDEPEVEIDFPNSSVPCPGVKNMTDLRTLIRFLGGPQS